MNWADALLQDAIRFALPLWLAGLGELVVQRGGMINIGIEGMMLSSALTGWLTTVLTGSPWLGLAAAVTVGCVLGSLFALVTLVFDADQVVAGTAINLLAIGATGMGFKLCLDARLNERTAPFFQPIDLGLPFDALDQYGLLPFVLVLAVAVHLMLRRTRFGVELIAMGEYPQAAVAGGIRVNARRLLTMLFGGACAGLAGCYLSTMYVTQFSENMTAGRGFLALAMVIFGKWKPLTLMLGGLFFGGIYALQNELHVISKTTAASWLPPSQMLEMMPYVLSLIVLAGIGGRTRAPAALGQPLPREN